MELENGDVYEGNWADGRKQGSGLYSYGNGDVYDGEWKKNMRDGWGVYIRKSGGRVVGFWEHNECVQEVAARASLLPDPMEALDHDIKRQRPRVPLLQLEALQVRHIKRSHKLIPLLCLSVRLAQLLCPPLNHVS